MTKLVFLFSLLFVMSCASQSEREHGNVDDDEQAIWQYYGKWMKATTEGELDFARSLIADDAVFLIPFADTMDKESYPASATAADPNTEFKLDCTIQEFEVLGDHAWLMTEISLVMIDKRSNSRSKMGGPCSFNLEATTRKLGCRS